MRITRHFLGSSCKVPTALTVQADGLVQAVDVPPGLGVLTVRYAPPGFAAGLALSLMAGVLVTGFFVTALLAWPPVAAGFARRVRKPVHHPRSPVSNPVRMLQDRLYQRWSALAASLAQARYWSTGSTGSGPARPGGCPAARH
jgi:hypothetical protein